MYFNNRNNTIDKKIKNKKNIQLSLPELSKNNITSLILDLRDNGWGILDEALEIADFIQKGVTTPVTQSCLCLYSSIQMVFLPLSLMKI